MITLACTIEKDNLANPFKYLHYEWECQSLEQDQHLGLGAQISQKKRPGNWQMIANIPLLLVFVEVVTHAEAPRIDTKAGVCQ